MRRVESGEPASACQARRRHEADLPQQLLLGEYVSLRTSRYWQINTRAAARLRSCECSEGASSATAESAARRASHESTRPRRAWHCARAHHTWRRQRTTCAPCGAHCFAMKSAPGRLAGAAVVTSRERRPRRSQEVVVGKNVGRSVHTPRSTDGWLEPLFNNTPGGAGGRER